MDAWIGALTALFGSGGIVALITTLWKAAKQAARNEYIAEEAQKTIAAKDTENARLWAIIDAFTRPEGRS